MKEKVQRALTRIVTALYSSRTRKLTASDREFWRRNIGCWRHIGIELETSLTVRLDKSDFQRSEQHLPQYTHLNECQMLFTTDTPELLIAQTREATTVLSQLRIPTTGSVHLNVVASNNPVTKDKKPFVCFVGCTPFCRNVHSDFKAIRKYGMNVGRFECKQGKPFFGAADLRLGLFIALLYIKRPEAAHYCAQVADGLIDISPLPFVEWLESWKRSY